MLTVRRKGDNTGSYLCQVFGFQWTCWPVHCLAASAIDPRGRGLAFLQRNLCLSSYKTLKNTLCWLSGQSKPSVCWLFPHSRKKKWDHYELSLSDLLESRGNQEASICHIVSWHQDHYSRSNFRHERLDYSWSSGNKLNHLLAFTNWSFFLFVTEDSGNKLCTNFAHVTELHKWFCV